MLDVCGIHLKYITARRRRGIGLLVCFEPSYAMADCRNNGTAPIFLVDYTLNDFDTQRIAR